MEQSDLIEMFHEMIDKNVISILETHESYYLCQILKSPYKFMYIPSGYMFTENESKSPDCLYFIKDDSNTFNNAVLATDLAPSIIEVIESDSVDEAVKLQLVFYMHFFTDNFILNKQDLSQD